MPLMSGILRGVSVISVLAPVCPKAVSTIAWFSKLDLTNPPTGTFSLLHTPSEAGDLESRA